MSFFNGWFFLFGWIIVKLPLPPSSLSPSLKLVRIMLETSNLARVSTNRHAVLENVPFSTKALLILLMSAFFRVLELC